MKRIMMMLVLAGTLLLSACGGSAIDSHTDADGGTDVEAHDYWARAALKDGTSAVYMLLHNHTSADDAIIGASSDVAEAVEIHLSQMKADGTMEMIPQESIALPAEGEVEFKPGGYHVMLIGLKKDLNKGDQITVTLHFKNHADITLTVPVMDAESTGGSGMDMHATPTP